MKEAREACGVFAAYSLDNTPVFPLIYWGLRAQNHRGHQSHGILTYDGKFNVYKALDTVPKIRKKEINKWIAKLSGNSGIGSVRYTTSGKTDEEALLKGAQPIIVELYGTKIGMVFNGNIVNTTDLKEEIKGYWKNFSYECDLELLARKMIIELMKERDIISSVKKCMEEVEGAFSVAGITKNGEMFAFKDPYGIRPLCCGKDKEKEIYAISSESVGLDINDLQYAFEIKPGEFISIDKYGVERKQIVPCKRKSLCAFEFAYFARPDSKLNDRYVYEVREEFGRNLGRIFSDITKKADMILSLPETADDAAFGLQHETGIRWERASRRHRYVTERAFIMLPQERISTIYKKINIIKEKVFNKNLIVIDDSIVRGDTTRTIIKELKKAGARKIFVFITFPRIISPCFYGIDMATYDELLGSKYSPEEIAKIIGADEVCYQPIREFVKATGLSENELCLGCVTQKYPTPLAQKMADDARKKFEEGKKTKKRIYEN